MPALVLLALLPSVGVRAQASPPSPPSASRGAYYLALGDSLAYGVTLPGIPPDPLCMSSHAPGYVCIVSGYLKQINPTLQLKNLSAPDVDSCVLLHGYGDGACANPPGTGALPSPLAAALAFIRANPGSVGLTTINIGGADLIPLLPAALGDPAGTAAKLPALFRNFQANLDAALSQLRAALGPAGRIVLITQYNPLGGIASPPLPAGLPEIARGAIASLDGIMRSEAAKYGVTVADVAAAFDANPGGAALLTYVPTSLASGDSSKIDIYPTPDGYRLFGDTVLKASGYIAPLRLTVHLAHRSVHPGKKNRVSGVTVSGAQVKVTAKPPHGRSAARKGIADNVGAYAATIAAGKRKGKAVVRVCTLDPVSGHGMCKRVSFTIR